MKLNWIDTLDVRGKVARSCIGSIYDDLVALQNDIEHSKCNKCANYVDSYLADIHCNNCGADAQILVPNGDEARKFAKENYCSNCGLRLGN